ncbi:hypothetical protein ACJZ2D_003756 [Fusarium nematophilum]
MHSTVVSALQEAPSSRELPCASPPVGNESVPVDIPSTHTVPINVEGIEAPRSVSQLAASSSAGSPATAPFPINTQKRKRSHFETEDVLMPDIVKAGVVGAQEAEAYFDAFFSGCDRYVPIFDLCYDTMHGIRDRSGLLFSAICSVGCRVLNGADSRHWRAIDFYTQRMVNAAIARPTLGCLETVQALLVRACYASERSLLIAIATRMALDLGFAGAYDSLSAQFAARTRQQSQQHEDASRNDPVLMRKTRAWLHLLVMGHILNVDAGGLPTFTFRGASRRCRVLLQSPFSTKMDHYLLAQVELNVLRAKIHTSLYESSSVDDQDILDLVSDARIDLDVWFHDWRRIFERHEAEMPWFTPNLSVQRCWADSMSLCHAVRASGVENVNAMSPNQKHMLLMAKDALMEHLNIILEEPRQYLRGLRYAMDFVWAKNAFCYLLLLKLALLLPDHNEQQSSNFNLDLVEKGRMLLEELSKAAHDPQEGARPNTTGLYRQLVSVSIEKYKQELNSGSGGQGGGSRGMEYTLTQDAPRLPVEGPQTDLESFIPEQFVFEWDFPGVKLFSSPTDWLDEFLTQTFSSAEEFYSLGWGPIDISL